MTNKDTRLDGVEAWQQPYAEAGHDIASVFNPLTTKCKLCGTPQIDLSEDLVYGPMRKCRAINLEDEDGLVKDIGRKCADDVGDAIRRNMQLMGDRRGKMIVATYGAATAIGAANGAFAAVMDGHKQIDEVFVDKVWAEILRPMILGQIAPPPSVSEEKES